MFCFSWVSLCPPCSGVSRLALAGCLVSARLVPHTAQASALRLEASEVRAMQLPKSHEGNHDQR